MERNRDSHIRRAFERLTGGEQLSRADAGRQLPPHSPERNRDSHIRGAFEQLTGGEQLSRAEADYQVRPHYSQRSTGSRRAGRPAAQTFTHQTSTYQTAQIHGSPSRRNEEHYLYPTASERTRNLSIREDHGRHDRQAGSAHQSPSGHSRPSIQRTHADDRYHPTRSHSTSSRYLRPTPNPNRGDPRAQDPNHTSSITERQSAYTRRGGSVSHYTSQVSRDPRYEPRTQNDLVRSNSEYSPMSDSVGQASRGRRFEPQPLVGPVRTNANHSPDRYFTLDELTAEPASRQPTPAMSQTESRRTVGARTTTTVSRNASGRLQLERKNSEKAPKVSRSAKFVGDVVKYIVGDY